jgi:hypothetical protein
VELAREAGALGNGGIAGDVGEETLDRPILRAPPSLETRPVLRAGHDAALLAQLEDDPKRGHAGYSLTGNGPSGTSITTLPSSTTTG